MPIRQPALPSDILCRYSWMLHRHMYIHHHRGEKHPWLMRPVICSCVQFVKIPFYQAAQHSIQTRRVSPLIFNAAINRGGSAE